MFIDFKIMCVFDKRIAQYIGRYLINKEIMWIYGRKSLQLYKEIRNNKE